MYRECTYSFHTYIHVPCVHITSLYIYICSMHIYRYIPYLSPYLYTGIYPIHVYIQVYTLSLCIYTCSMYINTCPVSTYIHMPSINILYMYIYLGSTGGACMCKPTAYTYRYTSSVWYRLDVYYCIYVPS